MDLGLRGMPWRNDCGGKMEATVVRPFYVPDILLAIT